MSGNVWKNLHKWMYTMHNLQYVVPHVMYQIVKGGAEGTGGAGKGDRTGLLGLPLLYELQQEMERPHERKRQKTGGNGCKSRRQQKEH